MKCVYKVTELTRYDDAANDKELRVWIKEWYSILNDISGLGTVALRFDKRNYKKIHPFMLLYKFDLKEIK